MEFSCLASSGVSTVVELMSQSHHLKVKYLSPTATTGTNKGEKNGIKNILLQDMFLQADKLKCLFITSLKGEDRSLP
jgi:hypothetical protein